MNLSYAVDRATRIVAITYSGNPDFEEWEGTMRDVFGDADYEPGFSFLLDRRLASKAPTTAYIRRIADFAAAHPLELGTCRTAVVVGEMASYGMARMSQAIIGDAEGTQIFQDIEEARQWLQSPIPNQPA